MVVFIENIFDNKRKERMLQVQCACEDCEEGVDVNCAGIKLRE